MATAGVLQIHPSLRCNLSCHHCYSSSGPDQRGWLDDDTLADLVSDAAALGYATLAVSGGEPLMFPGLDTLLRNAHEAGMRTMVTTNGTLVTPRRLEELDPVLDLLAFSLDGPPDVHNAVRNAPWAFAKLDRGLAAAASLASVGSASAGTVQPPRQTTISYKLLDWRCCGVPADIFTHFEDLGGLTIPSTGQIAFGG